MRSNAEMVIGLGTFNGHFEKWIDGFEGIHGGNGFGERNVKGEILLEFAMKKELCFANTWFKENEERKVTYRSGKNKQKLILY